VALIERLLHILKRRYWCSLLCALCGILCVLCGKVQKTKQNRKDRKAGRKVSRRNATDCVKLHQYLPFGSGSFSVSNKRRRTMWVTFTLSGAQTFSQVISRPATSRRFAATPYEPVKNSVTRPQARSRTLAARGPGKAGGGRVRQFSASSLADDCSSGRRSAG
jgi:hypothetical protein